MLARACTQTEGVKETEIQTYIRVYTHRCIHIYLRVYNLITRFIKFHLRAVFVARAALTEDHRLGGLKDRS